MWLSAGLSTRGPRDTSNGSIKSICTANLSSANEQISSTTFSSLLVCDSLTEIPKSPTQRLFNFDLSLDPIATC